MISVVMPVHNEVKSLEHVLIKWSECFAQLGIEYEFVICEDGSNDGTKELIFDLMTRFPISNQSTKERRGYGGGVIAGINASRGDHILCIDSDGQCMPDSFAKLFSLIQEGDIAIGIRSPRKDPFIRIIYSTLFLNFHRLLFRSGVQDPSCPFIIAKKNVFLSLMPLLGYVKEGFWWGFVGAAKKRNYTFVQIPITHYPRYDGSSVVYKLRKMPSIIFRNVLGLIKLRFSDI